MSLLGFSGRSVIKEGGGEVFVLLFIFLARTYAM